jgi:F-type H+-transporting ATPase subunit delta
MSTTLTFARPYARAAFELARGNNALASWSTKLAFAAEVAADPRVVALLGDPRVRAAELAALVMPENVPDGSPFAEFVHLLAANGRLVVLPEIAALFEQLKQEAERVLKVNVRSATPIGEAEAARLKEALKRRFARDIVIEQSIDASVLGGAVIDAGDVVIDGTVRGRLARLGQVLSS